MRRCANGFVVVALLSCLVGCSSSQDDGAGADAAGQDGGGSSDGGGTGQSDGAGGDGAAGGGGDAEGGTGSDATADAALAPPQDNVSNQYQSGTNLKARFFATSDGNFQFNAFYDTALGVECTFAQTPTGQRCVPLASTAFTSQSFYDDPGCTEQVGISLPPFGNNGASKYVVSAVPAAAACQSPQVQVFAAGAPKTLSAFYTRVPNGSCVTQYQGTTSAVLLGADVTSTMTAGVASVGPAQGGIAPSYLKTADGASAFGGWVDTTRSAPCTFVRAADGATRCVPSESLTHVSSGQYINQGCTLPAWVAACATAPAALGSIDAQCQVHAFSFGSASGTYYGGAACSTLTASSGYTAYGASAEIPASSFVQGTSVPGPSGARLQSKDVAAPGWKLRATPGTLGHGAPEWHDTTLGIDCTFATAADGTTRCLPPGMSVAYSEQTCTTPLGLQIGPSACQPPEASTFALSNDDAVPQRTHVFPVTGPYTGGFFMRVQGGCMPITAGAYDVFQLGAEIAPTTYQAATEVTL